MSAIYILWLRELKRYVRSRVQMFASLGQPVLYLLAFGFGFGPVFQKAGNGSYLQFIAPGVMGMSILFMCVFSGISILWDRQFGFLKETLVAPVPRMQVMLGRALGSATVATIQGILVFIVCTIAGFRPYSWTAAPLVLIFMAMVALTFASLGIAFGSIIKDMTGFPIVMNFMVMPMFFLSGALFPLENLPKALTVITHIDPLSYGIDGLRGTLTGAWHFTFAIDLIVLACVAALFLSIGSYLFSKIEP